MTHQMTLAFSFNGQSFCGESPLPASLWDWLRFSGPRIAGKFQFSGICDSSRSDEEGPEAIEVYGGADCLHPAAG